MQVLISVPEKLIKPYLALKKSNDENPQFYQKQMKILFKKPYDENDHPIPIACSESKEKLGDLLEQILKKSNHYNKLLSNHKKKCKNIIKSFLLKNLDHIVGFNGERGRKISTKEKRRVVGFLCSNYSSSYGANIVINSMIPVYCSIEDFSKPYPKLPEPPKRPKTILSKGSFVILDAPNLDKE